MRTIDGIVLDLDGTVYLGEEALPGAVHCISELRERGKRIVFVSNKPLQPRHEYAAKLTRLGIPTAPDQIITSAFVLGQHLASRHPGLRYYVIGETALKEEFRRYGLTVVDELLDQDPMQVIDPMGIDAVIVSFDRTLDYRKLNTAYQALLNGAHFFATNSDKTCPVSNGAIPDAGATIAALQLLSGREVQLLAGKPSHLIMQAARDLLQFPADRCLMVGDRLETDIQMGQEAGFATAVVLTGVTTRDDLANIERSPDIVLENLGELLDIVV